MTKKLETRPAQPSDEDFVWTTYAEAVRPLVEPNLAQGWIDTNERANFMQYGNRMRPTSSCSTERKSGGSLAMNQAPS